MIFIGNYSNDIRNGKGKEYNNDGILIFEGEYKKGKKWNGKIREYYDNELIFEGEYKNGKRWNGRGKELNTYNEILSIGEYKNGLI